MKVLIVLAVLVALAAAQQNKKSAEPEVTITKQYFDSTDDGSYSFGFINSDGTEREEKGYFIKVRNADGMEEPALVVEGSYTYYSSEGKLVKVVYKSGGNEGHTILSDTRL